MPWLWILLVVQLLGIATALAALFQVRTAQGTVAWVVALSTLPVVALPLFLLFGRRRFQGYVIARRSHLREMAPRTREIAEAFSARGYTDPPKGPDDRALVRLARLPFTTGNDATVLIDGEETFRSIFAGIDRAERYVLVQFYILVDDVLGRALKERLVARARAGVRVHVLYDEVGSHKLPDAYVEELRAEGVSIHAFNTRKGHANRFQLNFRNHRKLVVVDGREAWVGGLNAAIEYLAGSPTLGAWRDTHVHVRGPAAATAQVSFVEDWNWSTDAALDLAWDADPVARPGMRVLCLPTGPADELETGSLVLVDLIHRARSRLWIASPYFVPDSAVMSALVLAALRGVDVRVLLPAKADHRIVWLARYAYVEECERAGIRLLDYERGFLHQKVMVVDERFATIGTGNLDNRSLRLNFELTILFDDAAFVKRVTEMLERDFEGARPITAADLKGRGFGFALGVRVARLLAPIL